MNVMIHHYSLLFWSEIRITASVPHLCFFLSQIEKEFRRIITIRFSVHLHGEAGSLQDCCHCSRWEVLQRRRRCRASWKCYGVCAHDSHITVNNYIWLTVVYNHFNSISCQCNTVQTRRDWVISGLIVYFGERVEDRIICHMSQHV